MHLNAKPPVLASRPLAHALEMLSKAALIDLVCDLVRRMEGADITDADMLRGLAETYLPAVCRERGQKVPNLVGAYQRQLDHEAKYRAQYPEIGD